MKAKHDKSAQKALKGLNCPDYYLKGLILSDFNDKRSFKEYKKNEVIYKKGWENGPFKNTFSTKRRHRGHYFQKWGLVRGRQHKGGLKLSEALYRPELQELKPKVAIKGGSGPIHVVECAIHGTIYDLTFIPVKDLGNVGIGYHKGDSWLVINGLTRMSYLFKKGSHPGLLYFAEKLFPKDYWSHADIQNVYALYVKIMRERLGGP